MKRYSVVLIATLFIASLHAAAWAGEEMNKMGSMPPMPPPAGAGKPGAAPAAAPMPGMGMGMGDDKMGMSGMMGMMGKMGMPGGAMPPSAMPQSAAPGSPGASSLYHIGATGFFLDHPQHITLTTQQQASLNQVKEKALLEKITADRAIAQAEQELWTLTAADRPNAALIKAKVASIGKLTGDERVAFIRAVGDASKLLTGEQRQSLTGFAPPEPAMPAAPMKGM